MSRVILSVNDDNAKTMRVVVGWDRPLQTFFWQVFAPEPPIDPDTGYPIYADDWEEVEGYGGYVPREIERAEFLKTFAGIPDEVKDLISDEVLKLLNELHVHQDTQFNHQVWMVEDHCSACMAPDGKEHAPFCPNVAKAEDGSPASNS